jgi:tetratricopeptide (TPR) repeat protein
MSGRTVAIPSLMLLACAFALAQGFDTSPLHRGMPQIAARFSGVVRAQDGSPLQNAQVSLQDVNTGMRAGSTYTNSDGTFEIDNLPPGSYEVLATSGLSESRQRIQLNGGETSVDIRISAGASQSQNTGPTVSVAEMKVPAKARNEFDKARELAAKNKLEDARKHLDSALKSYPNFADALTLRGVLDMQEQKFQAAEQDLENAIKADPSHAPAYTALGAVFSSEHRFDDALRELALGESLNPGSWQAHFEMSKARLGKRDFAAALQEITKASSLAGKDYPVLHIIKADALIGIRDYTAAIAELKTYLGKEPDGQNSLAVRQQLSQVEAFVQSR